MEMRLSLPMFFLILMLLIIIHDQPTPKTLEPPQWFLKDLSLLMKSLPGQTPCVEQCNAR